MTQRHVDEGAWFFERVGEALQRIGDAGWPEIHGALAGYTRERRGRVKALDEDAAKWSRLGRDMVAFCEEVERLADFLEQRPTDKPALPRSTDD